MKINKFENAYGIKKVDFTNVGSNEIKSAIIYSSNGTFKSSFAETFRKLKDGKGNEVLDRLSDENNGLSVEIEVGDQILKETSTFDKFLVYSSDCSKSGNVKTLNGSVDKLIISNAYKEELSKIYKGIKELQEFFEGKISIDNELKKNWDKIEGVQQFNNSISALNLSLFIAELQNSSRLSVPTEINLSKLSQKVYNIIDNQEFQTAATNYIEVVNNELASFFFSEDFKIENINNVVDSMEKNNFLNENRRILIATESDGNLEFNNIEQFKEFYNNKINEVVNKNQETLLKKQNFEKALGTSQEAQNLKGFINNPKIISFLSNGRKSILYSLLKSHITDEELNERKERVDELVTEISKLEAVIEAESTLFEKALEIHRERFKPPFNIEINNKKDILINSEIPRFNFYPNSSLKKTMTYDETRSILSSGEKNAFDIINLIVEYESLKDKSGVYVILDDIVETFDYSNRMAFIEYISDMQGLGTNVIILTHNFEFYRTLSKRLNGDFKKMAAFNNEGTVRFCSSDDFFFKPEKVFKIMDKVSRDQSKEIVFLFSIPFVREVVKYLGHEDDFLFLLHIRKDYKDITVKEVVKKISSVIGNYEVEDSAIDLNSDARNYYEFILSVCDEIVKKSENLKYYDIFRKVILSMGCRLIVEKVLIGNDYGKLDDITKNQTRSLYDREKGSLDDNICQLIERTLLCSSEFIHINSFMYEPLVDIDPVHIVELYKELRELKFQ